MTSILTIVPVFVLIALGVGLRRFAGYHDIFFQECRKLTYWVALPCVLFISIATSSLRESWSGGLAGVTLIASGLAIAVAVLVSRRFCPDAASRASFLVVAFRGNFVYIGLPVILYAAATLPEASGIEARTALLFAVLVPFNNVASVVILDRCGVRSGGWTRQTLAILGNPLILACLAGVIVALSGMPLALPVARSVRAIGEMAMPLALLSLGAEMDSGMAREHGMPVMVASLIKVGLTPLFGWLLLLTGPYSTADRLIALVILASPTAVAAYVMCDQMRANGKLAAGVVVFSTLASAVSLSLAVALALAG